MKLLRHDLQADEDYQSSEEESGPGQIAQLSVMETVSPPVLCSSAKNNPPHSDDFWLGAVPEVAFLTSAVDGDDAGHCSSGLSAQNYRGATAEDRAIYRKWMLGMVVFYSMLLLISGVVAVVIDTSPGLTRLTTLSVHSPAGSPRSN
jgi:hypothetical protein